MSPPATLRFDVAGSPDGDRCLVVEDRQPAAAGRGLRGHCHVAGAGGTTAVTLSSTAETPASGTPPTPVTLSSWLAVSSRRVFGIGRVDAPAATADRAVRDADAEARVEDACRRGRVERSRRRAGPALRGTWQTSKPKQIASRSIVGVAPNPRSWYAWISRPGGVVGDEEDVAAGPAHTRRPLLPRLVRRGEGAELDRAVRRHRSRAGRDTPSRSGRR